MSIFILSVLLFAYLLSILATVATMEDSKPWPFLVCLFVFCVQTGLMLHFRRALEALLE